MQTTNLTDIFVNSLYEMSTRAIPEPVVIQAKMCVIDYLSCTYLGQSMLREQNAAYLDCAAGDTGTARVIGTGRSVSIQTAAMLNGINSHVAELDDGHRYGMMHLSAPVLSALFAVAQRFALSGRQLIRGVVLGYEAATRLASAIQPGHKLRGYHATGTCGTIGAAVAIAAALDLPKPQWKAAVSAAATDTAGLLEIIDNTSTLKPYNIGRAAVAAVNAVFAAKAGFLGPEDILGGKRGFFQVEAADVKQEYVQNGFSGRYAIELIYRKPYAACRHCHPAIEAAMNAAGAGHISPGQIRAIHIRTYNLAVAGHDHTEIPSPSSAKMSTPYSIAAALVYGKAGYQQFSPECIANPEIQSLMRKITVSESDELSALVPAKRGAVAEIETAQGTFTNRVDYPRGEPENPISQTELEEKFFSLLAAAGKTEPEARRILDHIWNIETEFSQLLMIV